MECTVTIDETLLRRAQQVLGTRDAEATIEASLREVVRSREERGEPVELPMYIRTDEDMDRFLEAVRRPRTEAELERWRAAAEAADQHRVKVGPDFNIVEIIRELRDRAGTSRAEQDYDE